MYRLLNIHLGATFAFLYIPIVMLMVLSLNKAGLPTVWSGFSLGLLASLPYHSNEKPPQDVGNPDLLKDKTISTAMGI